MKEFLPCFDTCFICGKFNSFGLGSNFFVTGTHVHCNISIPQSYSGYHGVVHGGILSALVDECMSWSPFVSTAPYYLYYTRNLEVKFKKKVTTMQNISVESEFCGEKRGIYMCRGRIRDAEGDIAVTANGAFVPMPNLLFKQTVKSFIFEDGIKYHEKALGLLNFVE